MGTTRLRRRLPSPALVIACVALFAALGGASYAATSLGAKGIHWTNAHLENGWQQGCCGAGAPGYAKDSLGVVHLRGALQSGSDDVAAFVLPSSMRPHHNLFLPVYCCGGNYASVRISHSGNVTPFGSGVTGFLSLAGITFVAGQ